MNHHRPYLLLSAPFPKKIIANPTLNVAILTCATFYLTFAYVKNTILSGIFRRALAYTLQGAGQRKFAPRHENTKFVKELSD